MVSSAAASEIEAAFKVEATPEKSKNGNHRNSLYHHLTYIPTFMQNWNFEKWILTFWHLCNLHFVQFFTAPLYGVPTFIKKTEILTNAFCNLHFVQFFTATFYMGCALSIHTFHDLNLLCIFWMFEAKSTVSILWPIQFLISPIYLQIKNCVLNNRKMIFAQQLSNLLCDFISLWNLFSQREKTTTYLYTHLLTFMIISMK